MEFITGGLFMLVVVLMYDRFRPTKKQPVPEPKDERNEEYQKKYNEHFDALFNYTPDKAYKKVK